MSVANHPAKFSAPIMEELEVVTKAVAEAAGRPIRVLDPMAGIGTIHRLAFIPGVETVGLEIEPEWAIQHFSTIEGDATEMPFPNDSFDIVAFSPPYGNRMADQFVSKDGTTRITYYHMLGRRLHENSAAGMHWGDEYRKVMREILVESKRVTSNLVILNVSDFVKNATIVPVVRWYVDMMLELRFKVIRDTAVATKRMGYGANRKLRVPSERVITFQKRR